MEVNPTWLNIVIFFLFAAGVAFTGLWMSRGERNSGDYFLVGGGLTWPLIGFSLIPANISAEQFVGIFGSAANGRSARWRPAMRRSSRSPRGTASRTVLMAAMFLACLAGGVCAAGEPDTGDRGPNVVLIMIDDFGAELVGAYGSEMYQTPRMDQLAAGGMRFTNAYTPPLCTPTRVQIMTGQYPFRNGWTAGVWKHPREEAFVDPEKLTLGHAFRDADYKTAVAGKWQLARFDDRPHHIERSGFDAYSVWTYRFNTRKHENTEQIAVTSGPSFPSRYWAPGVWQDGRLLRKVKGKYGPDIYNDRLLRFIDEHHDRPFMIYYPMNLTHRPFPNPPPDAPPRTGGDVQTRFQNMVRYTDALIGRLVDKLKQHKLLEETLILVTGDNGTYKRIRSKLDGRTIRGEKGKLTEAGTRVPMIAHWPGVIPAGTVDRDPVDTSDVLPTLADAAGIELPADRTLDGRSFLAQLKSRNGNPRDWVFVQLADRWFIRSRRYRLHQDGRLFEMSDRYDPRKLEAPLNEEAAQKRRKLQNAADELLPSAQNNSG